jgi:hypothetical protein
VGVILGHHPCQDKLAQVCHPAPRSILQLSAPLTLTNLSGFTLLCLSDAMIGRLGATPLSTATLANSFYGMMVGGQGQRSAMCLRGALCGLLTVVFRARLLFSEQHPCCFNAVPCLL